MSLDRRSALGLGLAAGFAAAAATARAEPEVSGDGQGRFAAAIGDIDAYAAQHVSAHSLPGLTVTIVGPGGLTAFIRRGYADIERRQPVGPERLFQIGSISKSFTALCIFRLMEAGKLRLEDPASRILPEIPWPAGGGGVTVQSLLNHSSGLPDDAPPFPRGGDQWLWQGFPVGAQWSYSNLGYALLGKMVERLEGRPLGACIESLILRPLNMTATRPAIVTAERAAYAIGYSPLYADRPYARGGPIAPGVWTEMVEGSGCVASTGSDMALYMRWLAAAGQGHGAPLLSDANAARFARATIDAPGWAVPGAKYANGLAVVPVGGRMLLHHTGGMLTFNSAIHVDPVAGVGCFASTNVGLIPYRPRGLTAYACARLRAAVEGAQPPQPPPVAPPAPDMADFQGRYLARDGAVLEISGATALLAGRRIALDAEAPDAFIARDPREAADMLVFRRSGKAVARAWWGQTEFVRAEAGGEPGAYTAIPPALAVLVGHYENDDPWRGGFRVTAQGDRLLIDGTTPATPLPGGGFRVGEKDWSPERLTFDGVLAGRPTRATMSGVDYVRRAT